ncbi:hypothetical protein ACQ4M4_00435 [Leptolyngbya sp. AN02str]|uniref:hypothetical protein n=1 Tax=Leptolyngbya sp. AN02str TaxID=3423363 RepID=UPI003D32135E
MLKHLRLGWIWLVAGWMAIAIWLVPVLAASANPHPPPQAWFHFVHRSSFSPLATAELQGLQVAECDTVACKAPNLLLEYGLCRDEGCLTEVPEETGAFATLHCAANTCLAIFDYDSPHIQAPFRLIAQFRDRLRISNVMELSPDHTTMPLTLQGDWRVEVTTNELMLTRERTPWRGGYFQLFRTGFGFTIVLELLVALLYVAWRGVGRSLALRILTIVGVVHLVTFPVVWFFFPSLQPFQYTFEEIFGGISLGIAVTYGLLLWFATRPVSTTKLFVSSITIVPFMLGLGFAIAWFFSLNSWFPTTVEGFSPKTTLVLSELFVFGYEGALIYRLVWDKVPLLHASLLSLSMNGVSLAVGLWLWRMH